jgi:transposase-like protein
MNNSNITKEYYNSSYALTEGRPYSNSNRSWNNRTRFIAAAAVISGQKTKEQVAQELNCCVNSVSNWVKTADKNNPNL